MSMSATATMASPHAHSGSSVTRTMGRVMLALTPATLFGFWLFGWPAINLWLITVVSAVIFEIFSLRLAGRNPLPAVRDGSAILTAWLLAMTLPPWAPWWVGFVGSGIAIVFAKQVFGGIGQNPFNPAMVARVALLVSFPVVMTQWVAPTPITAPNAPGFVEGMTITLKSPPVPDAIASASLLGYTKTEMSRGVDLSHSLTSEKTPAIPLNGQRAGSLGESASLLILIGGIFLLLTGVITWHTPVAVLAGIALPAAIGHALDPAHYMSASNHLLSGAAILGAFFIATDYVTSPNTAIGQLIFGLCVGLLTFAIRTWGGYPEGMAFAVMLMNALTPVIDRLVKPRILGRDRAGKPLDPASQKGK
jgi:Na+-translocating ferredoxin:NAD+ oxidoreductase subunit D